MAKYEAKESSPQKISVNEKEFSYIDFKKSLENYAEKLKLKILVCGQTGIGKSSLLNFLIGKQVFKVGGPGAEGKNKSSFDFDPCTSQVDGVMINVQGILLTIFDSPGLQDGTENDDEYLQDMYDKCSDADLVLYCMDMTTTRWLQSEVKATKLVTEKFGKSFWEKSILVLTKANMVQPSEEGVDVTQHGEMVYERFKAKFESQLQSQGVPQSIATGIPVIATGSQKYRHLPYVSSKVRRSATQPDFLAELWVTCLERLTGESRKKFIIATELDKRCKNKILLDELHENEASMREEMAKIKKKLTKEQADELAQLKKEHEEKLQQYESEFETVKDADILLDESQLKRTKSFLDIGKYVALGATAGSVGGPLGTIAGGFVGGVIGVIDFFLN